MKRIILISGLLILSSVVSVIAQTTGDADSLKQQILELKADVDHIQLNLGKAHKGFKTGILVATIGYSTVITGGMMLGRKNDDLGKVLLVTGGALGVVGTGILVKSFKFLGRASEKKKYTYK